MAIAPFAPLMESLVPGLEEWGVNAGDIYYESFGPATLIKYEDLKPEPNDASPVGVTFSRSGKSIIWDPAAGSLLEFAEAKGVEVDSGCRAGIHVYAILPWLALVAMLVNVLSGMTGKFLLDRSRRFMAEKKAAHARQGLPEEEFEKRLFWDATTFELMKKWRAVHLPITLAFAVLSIFLLWQWK